MKRKCKKYNFKLLNVTRFKLKYKIFAFFIFLIFAIVLYVKYLAIPIVVENTETQIKTFATKAINYAVVDTMNQNVSYGDLVNVVKDSSQKVSYIEANSIQINVLSKNMSKVVMSNFLELAKKIRFK